MTEQNWPEIAVLGAGAVGCYFGGLLARAGAPVTLIGRPNHVEAITRQGLLLDTLRFRENVSVAATTDVAAVRTAEIVLFCVKTLDTESAARVLTRHLAAETLVVSFQNGVDNVERMRTVAGIDAVPCGVYVAAEMTAPGCLRHTGRGDLIVGASRESKIDRRRIADLAALFVRAGIPCRVSDNIDAELWAKLIMNCAYNAISALSRSRYGRIAANDGTRAIMQQVVDEVLAVARAAGVTMPDTDFFQAVLKLGEAMPGALSSTAQDLGRGKRTEIGALNGHVVRKGAEFGVPTPVNQTLHALVKLLEAE